MNQNASVVQGNDLATQAQADARTVGLGGKEGNEDPFAYFRQDAFSIIFYGEYNPLLLFAGSHDDFRFRTVAAGLTGIFQQIEEHLFHLATVGMPDAAGGRIVREADVCSANQPLQILERFFG